MSVIERALSKREKRKPTGPAQSVAKSIKDLAAASGIFKAVSTAAIESNTMEMNKILPAVDDRAAINAYKMLRTRVLQRMRSNKWQSLIVTGAGASEGKTLTASNLAVSVSLDVNQSVVLVDLDLQRPMMASYFGLHSGAGIGDYLAGDAEIDDIVYRPEGMERIVVIPNQGARPDSSELLASPRMRKLLDWIKSNLPEAIAIFDMPPVLACDDMLAFAPYADAVLLVVAEGKTDRDALVRTKEMIGDLALLGVVLNKSREQDSKSAYYY